MDFKKGAWNVGEATDFNIEDFADLIDDKMAKNVVGDLKKHMGPEGFPRP